MKGVTVRGSIRNPKELASLVGRCNVFLYLSLPFCRQLIKNKQLGDIEVAIRSIKGNVDRAKTLAKKAYDEGFLDGKEVGKPGVEMIVNSSPKAQAKRRKTKQKRAMGETGQKKSNIAKGSPLADPKRNPKAPKSSQLGGRSRKMGGGKVYTSMDKKYGGGIFPRKGNI